MYIDYDICLYELEGWFCLLKDWPLLKDPETTFVGPFATEEAATQLATAVMQTQVEYLRDVGLLDYLMRPPK